MSWLSISMPSWELKLTLFSESWMSLPPGIWHANYYDWKKNSSTLRCRTCHQNASLPKQSCCWPSHSYCPMWERVGGLSYINKNVVQRDFTRGCVRERELHRSKPVCADDLSLNKVPSVTQLYCVMQWGILFQVKHQSGKICDTKNLTYCHKNKFEFNLLQW